MVRIVLGAAIVAVTCLAAAAPASALPVFARRYGMSCTTCHSGGPTVLNEFGEAFRDNGYRIPGDDAAFVARPPVALGAPARAALFPNTMWPGELPGDTPFALSGQLGVIYTVPPSGSTAPAELDPDIRAHILVGGSLGEHFSVFGSLLFYDELMLEQLYFVARSLFDDALGEMVLNVKVGQITPDINPQQPQLRRAITAPYVLSSPVARDGFTLASPSQGLELYGVLAGRVKWMIGVLNGNKPLDDLTAHRDVFGRASVILGGPREDYLGPSAQTGAPNVVLGAMAYWGSATNVPGPTDTFARYTNDILRVGGDARVRAFGLDLLGQFVLGRDSGATMSNEQLTHVAWSVDAEYRVFPWLIPYARFEEMRFFDIPAPADARDQRRIIGGLALFVRANIRLRLEGVLGLTANDPYILRGDLFFAL